MRNIFKINAADFDGSQFVFWMNFLIVFVCTTIGRVYIHVMISMLCRLGRCLYCESKKPRRIFAEN